MAQNMLENLQDKDVRQLQELARRGPSPRRRLRRPARTALLELIDILSRWSATGLAVVAGLGVYMAITGGQVFPARAAAWAALLFAALWTSRRLRAQFRSGSEIAARPFHWRAAYTSSLSVTGVIFASAPILLTPAEAPTALYLQIAAITILGAFSAAMAHSAHVAAAAAFALPASILPLLSALRLGDAALMTAMTAVSAMGLAVSYGLVKLIAASAARRNPRTTFLRREIDGGGDVESHSAPSEGTAYAAY